MTADPHGLAGIGHNRGPDMSAGRSWRRHSWTEARRQLLPQLPIEVLRLRLRRARELGLDYRSYASIRAASGHDVIAFLFSSNALRLLPPEPALPADRAARLEALINCGRIGLAQGRLDGPRMIRLSAGLLEAAGPAPAPFGPWAEARQRVLDVLTAGPGAPLSPGEVVLVGDTTPEREWCAAARLAGYLPAERFFTTA
ncbi:hypothetical protein ACFQXB_08870 [Plastorhodobacter daqingensis]|uniref:Uncharacterized protein n=1 Tax=Plastorhodobacter daqingensis TaxID=1387281 RepID=A0ABW2UHY3_9RHOB